MSLQIRLSAITFVILSLANVASAADTELAVFYSFDIAPSAHVTADLQTELSRVLAPSRLRVDWRPIGDETPEDFSDLVVIRFRGACVEAPGEENRTGDNHLGETEVVEGHVISFADVRCDELRRYLGGNGSMGRAMARVAAHEIYHMLTGSVVHGRAGIARAEHSRAELSADTFDFAPTDMAWLKQWAERRAQPESARVSTGQRRISRNAGSGTLALLRAAGVAQTPLSQPRPSINTQLR